MQLHLLSIGGAARHLVQQDLPRAPVNPLGKPSLPSDQMNAESSSHWLGFLLTLVLGIEPSASAPSYILSPFFIFDFETGSCQVLSFPSWTGACDPFASRWWSSGSHVVPRTHFSADTRRWHLWGSWYLSPWDPSGDP